MAAADFPPPLFKFFKKSGNLMERWKLLQIHWVPCPFEEKPILERVGASVNELTRDLVKFLNCGESDSVRFRGTGWKQQNSFHWCKRQRKNELHVAC